MNWKNDTSLTIRSSRKGCSEAIMADYKKSSVHCHSTMCDGKNTLQDMASAACAQGLTTLGFTGHSYTQRDREYCMSPSRTAQYKATIAKLKAEYKGKVDILCGIEWDILSEDKRTGYDYWIGSAHHLYGKNTGKYYELSLIHISGIYPRRGVPAGAGPCGQEPECAADRLERTAHRLSLIHI